MKTKLTFLFMVVFALIVNISCEKVQIAGKSRKEMLVNKRWQISAKSVQNGNGVLTQDAYSSMPANEKDDFFIFNSDSTYEFNDNTNTRTDSTSVVLDAGTWELIDNDKYLELHSTVFTTTYNPSLIKELTDTKLYLETRYPGDGSIIWLTFKPF